MREQIEGFLEYLTTEKKCSENTTSAYRNDLTQFLDSISQEVQSWEQVGKPALTAYIRTLQQQRYASSTIARKVAAVKSFFHFMLDTKLLSDDPTATLDSPKVKKRLPKILSPEEVETLLDEPVQMSDPKSLRDKNSSMLRACASANWTLWTRTTSSCQNGSYTVSTVPTSSVSFPCQRVQHERSTSI
jgi:integrase/recombinase XerD